MTRYIGYDPSPSGFCCVVLAADRIEVHAAATLAAAVELGCKCSAAVVEMPNPNAGIYPGKQPGAADLMRTARIMKTHALASRLSSLLQAQGVPTRDLSAQTIRSATVGKVKRTGNDPLTGKLRKYNADTQIRAWFRDVHLPLEIRLPADQIKAMLYGGDKAKGKPPGLLGTTHARDAYLAALVAQRTATSRLSSLSCAS